MASTRDHIGTIRRSIPPVAVGLALALLPTPTGLEPRAWYYFALFAAVIVGIITEPVPGPVVGLAAS
jgi:L-tartrate/succinate antiporter